MAHVYDSNGKIIRCGDDVIWTDPDGGRKTRYTVIEEPEEEMIKMENDYSYCEAFPHELLVVKSILKSKSTADLKAMFFGEVHYHPYIPELFELIPERKLRKFLMDKLS